ncbi:MAG: Ryanodine receptor Ryr [Bacteroidales bacterium]|nr:Ryanodine receptor Ryr [Bacteroidales bacterium]
MTIYTPNPINTDDVELNGVLLELTEKLAENVHEMWALGRINDGWRYGEKRDDAAKTHPCLVPYSQLPDSEREYDRNTAMSTLKLIVKLGYKIEK